MSKLNPEKMQEQLKEMISQSLSGTSCQIGMEKQNFSNLRKETILQEAKCFNEAEINPQKCRVLLSQLIYLINQVIIQTKGAKFTENESGTLFFQITKLFNQNNPILRRLLYLIIKELKTQSSIFIITSSILKDVTSKNDNFRMNAIRLVPIITDPSNLFQIERYLQNVLIQFKSIVDKNSSVSLSAILVGLEMSEKYPEVCKKWTSEISTILTSKNSQNQYIALLLFYEMKKQDLTSFYRVLNTLIKNDLNFSPLFSIQMIRFIKEYLQENENEKNLLIFIEKQLNKSSDMVSMEACKALCELKFLSNKELHPVMAVLRMFLMSNNTIFKFATLKIINKLISNPERIILFQNTNEIEAMLQDNNKSLVCFAISLLLKTCNQTQIEDLLKKVLENIGIVSDEFKIDILKSIKLLIKKHPQKIKIIVIFLADLLKDDGSQEFKQSIIETIDYSIQNCPECAEVSIISLLEFIEDCSHNRLHLQIIYMVGQYVYKLQIFPQKYLFNRINLEQAEIRTACINTLGKFGLQFPELKPQIKNIMNQVFNDPDEETRERALYFLTILEEEDQQESMEQMSTFFNIDQVNDIEKYIKNNLQNIRSSSDTSLLCLNKVQFNEINYDNQSSEEEFAVSSSQQIEQTQTQTQQKETVMDGYGDLLSKSGPIQLTDKKSEYLVSLYKYHFEEVIVFEFQITNSLDDINIENVDIKLEINNENLQLLEKEVISVIKSQNTQTAQYVIAKNPDVCIIVAQIKSLMTFKVVEQKTSYDEEYQLEDFEITLDEYLVPKQVNKFEEIWDKTPYEAHQTYQLQYKSLNMASSKIQKHFKLFLNDERKDQQNANLTVLFLSGTWYTHQIVLVKCTIGFDARYGCVVKIQARSTNELVAQNLSEALQ